MSKQLLKELFVSSINVDGLHVDVLIEEEPKLSELSERARKKKRIYKRKKAETKPVA